MKHIDTFVKSMKAEQKRGWTSETHPNREGAPSYHRSLEEQTVQVLTTGTLGTTFYASGEQLGTESMQVLTAMRKKDSGFLARALCWAREQGYMKTLPILGLAIHSAGRGTTKESFETIFDRIVRIPDDLRAFAKLCTGEIIQGRKGLGGYSHDAVRAWVSEHLNEYWALKYGSNKSEHPTLRDILRMVRPVPTSPAQAELFRWIVRGELEDDPSLNPKLHAFEQLKKSTNEQEIIECIRKGRLPFEIVIPVVKEMTPAIWTELLYQAPYQNLLRNLATFTRHGVFTDEKNVEYAIGRLTDARAIEHAKVLPFRFFNAWKKYKESEYADIRIADALRQALEISFVNMPEFGGGTVALGIDVSGSMGRVFGQKGSMKYCDIAGIFTGALLKRIQGRAISLPFEGHIVSSEGISGRDDIMVTAEKISEMSNGGSTAVGAPIEHLMKNKIAVDTFIGITDDQEWAYGEGYDCSGSFIELWRRYKKEVNPNAKAFLVRIAPYRDSVAPKGEKDMYFISGWNANALRFIVSTIEGGAGQVETIKSMSIEKSSDTLIANEEDENEL